MIRTAALSLLALCTFSSTSVLPQKECGLGKEFHKARRAELMRRMPGELMVFRGLGRPRSGDSFRQDDTFWYLTGIESPDVALILDAETGREILLLPPPDPSREARSGQLWDAEDTWVSSVSGFTDITRNDPETNVQLTALLEELLGERKSLGVALYPSITTGQSHHRAMAFERRRQVDRLDGRLNRSRQLAERLEEKLEVRIIDLAPALKEMRWRKTSEEIGALREAGRIGALAVTEAMRSTAPGVSGSHLAALMNLTQVRAGAEGSAFPPIVQSGRQTTMLASTSDREMVAGEVVLAEFGSEFDHYASHMSRTWPVSGVFNEKQAELYDVVLEAWKAGLAAAKPGAKLVDVDAAVTKVFRERGLFDLRRHFACHFVGLEPVDPSWRQAFEPGVVITLAPGLYDRNAGFGVRIEDLILITEEGAEVLTEGVPRERKEIETRIKERGVFDWMDDRRN